MIFKTLDALPGFFVKPDVKLIDGYFVLQDERFTVIYNNVSKSQFTRGFEVLWGFNDSTVSVSFKNLGDVVRYVELIRSTGK